MPPLLPGDVVGLMTPSYPAAGMFPRRYQRGVRQLEALGYQVRPTASTTSVSGESAADPSTLGAEFTELFRDSAVSAVLCTLGGSTAKEILRHIDWPVVRRNPKALIGYSDVTCLLHAFSAQTGYVSYYGPTLMTEFAEFPEMPDYSRDSFISVVSQSAGTVTLSSLDRLVSERIEWESAEEGTRPRSSVEVCRGHCVKPGRAAGPIVAGCLETLRHLRGTPYWLNPDGGLLIIESSRPTYDRQHIASILTDFRNMGVFDKVAGVVFGQKPWPPHEIEDLADVIAQATRDADIPVLIGLPLGHVTPIATLPLGARAVLDSASGMLGIAIDRYLEPG